MVCDAIPTKIAAPSLFRKFTIPGAHRYRVSAFSLGQTAWNGFTGASWASPVNWSTDPALPASGDDIVIGDTTTDPIDNLGGEDRSIGSPTFGRSGTRAAGFDFSTDANVLTIGDGLIANGAFGGTGLTLLGDFLIDQAQSCSIGGQTGNIG